MTDTPQEKKRKEGLRAELRAKTSGYIVTALGLVAGLAWNDAVSELIKYWYPEAGGGVVAKFMYAFIITGIIVLVSHLIIKFIGPRPE